MTKPTPLRPFEAELLPMLAQVATQTHVAVQREIVLRPARRWPRVALAAAVAVSLALVLPVLSDDPLRGALAIDRHGDTLHISVGDATADPEAMTNDLRALGLDAEVEVVPVSPSLEGTWLDIVSGDLENSSKPGDRRIDEVQRQMSKRVEVLKLPADFSGPFLLRVGRPAEAGETFQVALTRDIHHAYRCLGLQGMSPEQAAEAIAARGYEAVWYYSNPNGPFEVLDEAPSDKVITGAEFMGPTTVMVTTAEPGTPPHAYSGSDAGASGSC
jgi:hypothetical protein